jgi:ubiquinone biosynthesis accessory factor UbiK
VARRLPSPPVVPTEGRVAPGVPGATTRTDPTAQRLSALVPPGLREAREDLTATFRSVLQAGLRELDLVTREEFDVQRCVLLRTREKIEELEQQLLALERAVGADTPKP